ncbi:MAG: DUF3857 domain-containing protein, partial [Bacteroidota bacterium]
MKIQPSLWLKSLSLICGAFILIMLPLSAQKDYKWDKKVKPTPAISAEFKEADAVMIYNFEQRQTYFQDQGFYCRNIIKRRIKIQTQLGLERYARIILPKKRDMRMSILDARTIKKDGSIVDLDAKNDIKVIELTSDDDLFDRSRYKVFSVPGVEVGDEIEVVCIHEGDN